VCLSGSPPKKQISCLSLKICSVFDQLLFIGFLSGIDYKTTTILLDGRRVKLELWDTSGQGRFCTIFRSYSRGAQGILLVYDITNRWSFDGIDRWIKEIDEHAPGVPRILVGNRLHLAFKRQVPTEQARAYAEKNCMTFFEVSPLCNFNVIESFTELSRIVLMRHGMEKIWRPNRGDSCSRGRENPVCQPAPVTKLSAWAPVPDLTAVPLSPAHRGMASGIWLHLQTSPEPLPEAGLVTAACPRRGG
uniref:small monomeric GTPase n=1 Tax=Athene cunicularia TaxID=194338 RepID=A0A663LRS9_ATHCN